LEKFLRHFFVRLSSLDRQSHSIYIPTTT
jgi:hypothetical protein